MLALRAVTDWPVGKPGDFPVGPCFKKFFAPPVVKVTVDSREALNLRTPPYKNGSSICTMSLS